jgi:hypothetical protein
MTNIESDSMNNKARFISHGDAFLIKLIQANTCKNPAYPWFPFESMLNHAYVSYGIKNEETKMIRFEEMQKRRGGPGHRSQYLSHAKRALYHLS